MKSPKTIKQVQELTRRVATLGRFMSKSAKKCLPFFKAIRKAKDFEWIEECQKSFEELKRYLSSPPLLTKPVTGEDLFLYLSISESHTIIVLTDQPLGKVIQNPDTSGRLVNWSVELGEFDIKYQPRTAIKAQALSDFVVECTIPEDPQQLIFSEVLDPWLLYVDGSSKVGNSRAELILISPEKFKIERFVIVAIDYFTKWTEAETLATITTSKCEEFFWKNVVCRFGVPKILITDNGKQFDNSNFQSFCEGLSISLRFTSVAYPQSNGQTENMNRSILQGLKRKLDDAKGAWVDELPKAENKENLRGNLDLLDDVRAQALDRMISTKQRVARFYNQRVRMRIFRVGDLVLKKLEVSDPKAAVGKLSPNWGLIVLLDLVSLPTPLVALVAWKVMNARCLPDAMSRAASDPLNPDILGVGTNGNAIVSGPDYAAGDGNARGVLHVDAVCVWAVTRGYNPHILDPQMIAPGNRKMT
ncbi:hypothetical protein RJ639_032943 [Escallonia herrerae]|uniref:Integrase catalytic domain-containing protein n=1 Tax=Escallonia herrerae TaxID=1293975 RepID=A0AA89BB84_9ASTE|nr:hypothetical protein RJ639_032943 [Escallonia herrerae]